MSAITSKPIDVETEKSTTFGRLFFLDLGGGRVLSANPDGSDLKTIISEGRKLPDGLVVDVAAGHLYWTNMGDPKKNDGSILRSDLDGKNIITIVPPGGVFTPKQLQLDPLVGLMKVLGTPDVTPELKKTIAEGVSQIAGDRSVEQLALEEDEVLVGLIKLRTQQEA